MKANVKPRLGGFTVLEMAVALGLGSVLAAVLATASISVQRSLAASKQYVTSINNECRLVDYVAQDLRRAVRVGQIVSGTYSKATNLSGFAVSETNLLAINIPDYYGSNVPDNSAGSNFKTTRYPRAALNTSSSYNSDPVPVLRGCVPWSEAVTTVNSTKAPRYAPAAVGAGEIQVRYFRGPRSANDATICYFRGEYPVGSNTPIFPPREIAEQIVDSSSTTALIVDGYSKGSIPGMRYRLQSSFTPRYRRSNNSTAGTQQYVNVSLRNLRRD